MIYIGHFAHRTPNGPRPSHGYITTMIDAATVDSAIAGMVELLHRLQTTNRYFSPGTEVTLVNCVELRQPSRDAILMQFWSLGGSDFVEVSTSLPGVDVAQAASFTLTPTDMDANQTAVEAVVLRVSANGTLVPPVNENARDGPSS